MNNNKNLKKMKVNKSKPKICCVFLKSDQQLNEEEELIPIVKICETKKPKGQYSQNDRYGVVVFVSFSFSKIKKQLCLVFLHWMASVSKIKNRSIGNDYQMHFAVNLEGGKIS